MATKQILGTPAQHASNQFGQVIPSGAHAELYSVPTVGITTIAKEISVCNPTTVDALLTLCIKGPVDGYLLSNSIFKKAFVPAGTTVFIQCSSVIAYGKGIYAQVDTDYAPTQLNIAVTGVELSGSTAKQMYQGLLSAAEQTVYTAPIGKETTLYQLLAVNGDTTARKVSIQFVPPSGVIGQVNELMHEILVDPGETLQYNSNYPIPAGWRIVAKADIGNVVNLTIDGVEK